MEQVDADDLQFRDRVRGLRGNFIATAVEIEDIIDDCLRYVFDVPFDRDELFADSFLDRLMLGRKKELIVASLKSIGWAGEYKQMIADLDWLNERRNDFAHGRIVRDLDPLLRGEASPSPPLLIKRRGTSKPVTVEKLEEDQRRADTIQGDLLLLARSLGEQSRVHREELVRESNEDLGNDAPKDA